MSEITDQVVEYREGRLPFEGLDYLTRRDYADPTRYGRGSPRTPEDVERAAGNARYGEPGTWDEVLHCRDIGLLKPGEYTRILKADAKARPPK